LFWIGDLVVNLIDQTVQCAVAAVCSGAFRVSTWG
jgi:hypothetical protein